MEGWDYKKEFGGLKLLLLAMYLWMITIVITTSFQSNLWELTKNFHAQDPWFGTTLWDFYFNITIISLWVSYKEKNRLAAVGWIVGFVLLGSIATTLYVLRQLGRLKKGDSFEKILLREGS